MMNSRKYSCLGSLIQFLPIINNEEYNFII